MLIFVRLGCLTFAREDHPIVTIQAFLILLVIISRRNSFWNFLYLLFEELYEAAMAKKSTAAGLDGWAWNEIKALSLLGL